MNKQNPPSPKKGFLPRPLSVLPIQKAWIILPNLLFGALLVIMILIAFISYNRINSLNETNLSIAHNKAVNLRLNQILISVLNVETGERGYLLTSDTDFLKPYIGSEEKIWHSLDSLEILFAGNQQQKETLQVLKSLVATRYRLFSNLPRGSLEKDTPSAIKLNYLNNGKDIMDHIRSLLVQMSLEENKILDSKIPYRTQIAFLTPFYSLLFSIIGILIVTFSYFRLKREITLRISAERNLQDMNRELSLNNAELSSFGYVASHDLQEPLRKIRSFSSLILHEENTSLSDKGRDYLQRISKAAARMQELIIALLSYSSTNVKDIPFEQVPLNDVVNEAIDSLSDAIEKKQAVITVPDLPVVQGIKVQITQVFTNIIANAIKYADKERRCMITITAEKVQTGDSIVENFLNQPYWKISVTDNGIGFEQQYASRIFELFQRLHGRSEYAGTGIGLALCKKIMNNHNGFITAHAEPGKGATFELFFPEK